MFHLLYAIHEHGNSTLLSLVYSQTVTPTFLIFPFGQFCTGVDEVIDILPGVIGIDQILLQVQSII